MCWFYLLDNGYIWCSDSDQTVGHDRSLVIMERADPLLLLVVLPLVPIGLGIGQMIRWEETVLRFLRMTVPKTPLVRSLLPSFAYRPDRRGIQSTIPPRTDEISLTRIFCGALFFPTIATFLGATLFKHVETSQFKRNLPNSNFLRSLILSNYRNIF